MSTENNRNGGNQQNNEPNHNESQSSNLETAANGSPLRRSRRLMQRTPANDNAGQNANENEEKNGQMTMPNDNERRETNETEALRREVATLKAQMRTMTAFIDEARRNSARHSRNSASISNRMESEIAANANRNDNENENQLRDLGALVGEVRRFSVNSIQSQNEMQRMQMRLLKAPKFKGLKYKKGDDFLKFEEQFRRICKNAEFTESEALAKLPELLEDGDVLDWFVLQNFTTLSDARKKMFVHFNANGEIRKFARKIMTSRQSKKSAKEYLETFKLNIDRYQNRWKVSVEIDPDTERKNHKLDELELVDAFIGGSNEALLNELCKKDVVTMAEVEAVVKVLEQRRQRKLKAKDNEPQKQKECFSMEGAPTTQRPKHFSANENEVGSKKLPLLHLRGGWPRHLAVSHQPKRRHVHRLQT